MRKTAKKNSVRVRATAKPEQPDVEPKHRAKLKHAVTNLNALRKAVLDADADLTKAGIEAEALVNKGLALTTQALKRYREAAALYWEACRKAGVGCEFRIGRLENEGPRLTFFVEKAENGIRVLMKGKPGREDAFGLAFLKASLRKAAKK